MPISPCPPPRCCQGGMTWRITKQPSHVSVCSLCQPRGCEREFLQRRRGGRGGEEGETARVMQSRGERGRSGGEEQRGGEAEGWSEGEEQKDGGAMRV